MRKKRKKKKRSKKIIIFFLLITLALIYYFIRVKKPADYIILSSRVNGIINETLIKLNVGDKDIFKIYREERKKGKVKWIWINKEVFIPDEIDFESFKDSIENSLKRAKAKIYKTTEKQDSLTLEIGIDRLIMQTLKVFHKIPEAKYKVSIIVDDVGYSKKR